MKLSRFMVPVLGFGEPGTTLSRIRGVSLSILYRIFRLLYFFTYPAKYGKFFAYYQNKMVKNRGIMITVKQDNYSTYNVEYGMVVW